VPPGRYTSTVAKMRISPRNEESRIADLRLGIVCGVRHEHADTPHALALLRARRERPRAAAAPSSVMKARLLHSITSSARTKSDGGTSRPSGFAVLRLRTVWYFVGACTGTSAAFAPRRMRSTRTRPLGIAR
jgi:hypothetical protein